MTYKPAPKGSPKKEIEKIANNFRIAMEYEPGDDLLGIINDIGGKVVYLDNFDQIKQTGSLYVKQIGNFSIYLPFFTSSKRDRFTMAHELGHYVLHLREDRLPMSAARSDTGRRVEWEANWFAAEFLMPKAPLKERLGALDDEGFVDEDTISELASEWFVSYEAMEIRIESIGYVCSS